MSGLGPCGACGWITGITRALLLQLLLTAMGMTAGPARAQDCQDSGPSKGEVAVASVFATLGFVGLVLVIVYIILRRRQGGFLFPPKRTRRSMRAEDAEEGEGGRGDHRANCYDNQAFASTDTQESQGRGKSSPSKKHSPAKKSPSKDKEKTWASLPGQHNVSDADIQRKGSCGSLDNNYGGPETVSVWLQSQDIIGLGFNISGNMRDGIFVSQVHNRGPAVESGKIKVGDRIVSVTIAYDNIVYEDALTILSYASPYPVKVTLQKERAAAAAAPEASRQASSEQLNHPLYRSQSLDNLQRAAHRQRHQEALPAFRAKRTQSEMKCETRGSRESPRKLEGGWAGESGMSQSCPATSPSPFSFTSPYTHHRSDVEVHTPQVCGEAVMENAAVKLPTSGQVGDAGTDSPDSRTRKNSRLDTESAREFADMMDRMMEENKEREEDGVFSVSPKTPPSKPQRKNKPSSSSLEDMSGIVEEETVQTTMAAPAQTATPPRPQSMETKEEAEEEQIQPAHVKREVIIGSQNIQFTAIDPHADPVKRADSPDGFVSVNLSNDQDDTHMRPPSPQVLPVSEEVIEAVKVVKEVQTTPLPSLAQQTPVEKKKKEKPKGPVLNEEELERLIAMNSFPPGTQGLAGIRAGGKEGGVHDKFLPRELFNGPAGGAVAHSRNGSGSSASSSSDDRSQRQTRIPRGGVAFEVRDDVLTGRPVSVDLTASRSRNASLSPSRDGRGASESLDRIGRASSLRDDHHHHHDLPQQQPREPPLEGRSARQDFEKHSGSQDGLEWSGKRLVRSGSFQLIPQDEALLGDWTDRDKEKAGNDDDDDDLSAESGTGSRPSTAEDAAGNPADSEGSSEVELALRPLPDKNFFKARENLASLSDLSNSLSLSSSSSSSTSSDRSSAPSPPPSLSLNGPAYSEPDGRLSNSQSSGSSFILVEKPSADDHNGNSKSLSSLSPLGVSVTLTRQDDMDC